MTKNLFNITGRVIIMTGGTGVLGGCAAKYLAAQGAIMIILGRKKEAGDKLVNEIAQSGGKAQFFVCDVLEADSLKQVRDEVMKTYGKIDVLINAAGGNMPGATIPPDKTFFDLNMDDFDKVVQLNLTGTVLPTQIFSEPMVKQGHGCVLNFSSVSALRPLTRVGGYAAAKAAVSNFTQFLAVEFGKKYGDKFRVNAIIPGFFLTEQNRTLLTNPDGSHTDRAKSIIRQTPFSRFGEPEELCGCIHYLISDASLFVNGTVNIVDGGFDAFCL